MKYYNKPIIRLIYYIFKYRYIFLLNLNNKK